MTTQENKEVHPSIQQEIEQTNLERSKWTTKQWYEHVGAWETPEGHISFGSVMAVSAMLIQFKSTLCSSAFIIGSIEDFNEFNRLIDELEGAAVEAYSVGNEFGTAEKHLTAYSKLVDYIDSWATRRLQPDVKTLQFLDDVVTAADLLENGRQSKGLAERIRQNSFALRSALFNSSVGENHD